MSARHEAEAERHAAAAAAEAAASREATGTTDRAAHAEAAQRHADAAEAHFRAAYSSAPADAEAAEAASARADIASGNADRTDDPETWHGEGDATEGAIRDTFFAGDRTDRIAARKAARHAIAARRLEAAGEWAEARQAWIAADEALWA